MLSRDGVSASLEQVLTLPIRQADFSIEKGKDDKGEAEFVRSVLLTPDTEGGMATPVTTLIGQITTGQMYRRAFFEKVWKIRPDDGKVIYDKIAYRPPATCQARYNDRSGEPNGFRQQVWLFGGNLMLSSKQKVPGYVDIPKMRSYIYTHNKHREPLTGAGELEVAWWNLANGTLVQTPDGPVKIEDIEPGDYVFGRDGQPTQVLETVTCGRDQMYRVTFQDGRAVECGANHMWGVYDKGRRVPDHSGLKGRYCEMTTQEILDIGLLKPTGKFHRQWRFAVPKCEPVEYPERVLPIDPYVLGAWLGDGSLIRKNGKRWYPSFACMPESRFIVDEINRRLPVDIRLAESGDPKFGNWLFRPEVSWDTHSFRDALVALGVIECMAVDKFIPQIYMQGSVKQRLDLLRGLMDTDGTCYDTGSGNSQARFITASHRLAFDVQSLVRSLGGTATIGSAGQHLSLYVQINLDECPFLLPRKADKWTRRGGDPRRGIAIISIEPTSVQDSSCVVVAAKDHLFVVNDYVVTRNCYQTKLKILYLWRSPAELPRVPVDAAPCRVRERPADGDPQRR